MKLKTSYQDPVEDPDADDIRDALRTLDTEERGFMILSRGDHQFIQSGGSPENGFDLEFQDGSTDEHYRAEGDPFTRGEVEQTYIQYLRDETGWKDEYTWNKKDLSSSSGCLSALLLLPLIRLIWS